MNPRQFFDEFVEPTIVEWRSEPLVVRRAVAVLCELDNLAEHFLHHTSAQLLTRKAVSTKRDRLGESAPVLALARDVHDTHKHGPLVRKTATIKRGQRPKKLYRGGAFQADAFQEDAFQVGTPMLVIEEDDGTEHSVEDVISAVLAYWQAEFSQRGI